MYSLLEQPDEPALSAVHHVRLSQCVGEITHGSAERDLIRAFIAVDWLVRRVLAWILEAHERSQATDLRAFAPLDDSYRALCAKELCECVARFGPPFRTTAEIACSAISELVWADAAMAARSTRPHPLVLQVERAALSHAFSDPQDAGYLERAGEAVGRGLREALAAGVALDLVASELGQLWTRLRNA